MSGMVKLREITLDDADFVLEIRNDLSTISYLHNTSKFSKEEFVKWFKEYQPEWYIILNNETPVGYVRTKWISRGEVLQIGADIHPAFRRQGLATKAYNSVFEKYKPNNRFELEVLDNNSIAIELYKKIGFIEKERYDFNNGYGSKSSIVMVKYSE
jgi:ribosomal protein S18 acetylase RimI-like enzyme